MEDKKVAGEKAVEYVKDGMVVGLGTGSTAYYMIKKLSELVQKGMNIKAVATSKATEKLAVDMKIPLMDINEVEKIDLAIDGVDEIDRSFNAIKGGGGALFREKIVASLADEVIWIMDSSKLVEGIGEFPLPVEVLPYGYRHVFEKLEKLGYKPVQRVREGKAFVTDNGNYIIDLHLGKPIDIIAVSTKLKAILGILETGLFLNMCKRIIIGREGIAEVYESDRR